MKQSKIVFSNGDELLLQEDDVLTTVNSCDVNGDTICSMNSTVVLENSFHDGLIPSILKAVCNNPYFYAPEGIDVIYNSSAIVKIENL